MTILLSILNSAAPASVVEGQGKWVNIIPARGKIANMRDENMINSRPEKVVELMSHFPEIVLDVNHSSVLKAPVGEDSPAYGHYSGWRTDAQGGIEGFLTVNSKGAKAINGSEYKYLSPVILHDRQGTVLAVSSVALTNQPNFIGAQSLNSASGLDIVKKMSALLLTDSDFQTTINANSTKDKPMRELLIKLYGLDKNATDEQVAEAAQKASSLNSVAAAAITKFGLDEDASADDIVKMVVEAKLASGEDIETSANAAVVDLTKFVPRADYDALKGRIESVEESQKVQDAEARDGLIQQALNSKSIGPSQVEFHRTNMERGGKDAVDAFRKFATENEGSVAGDIKQSLNAADLKTTLTSAEKDMARKLGLKDEDFLKTRNSVNSKQEDRG